jgi:STE24 endopeptidase
LIVGALVLWVPYWLLGRSPQRWWLWTGMLALPFYALTLVVVPLWIAPLFNKFGPMKDKALEAEVLATAQKAGVEGARVFEVNKSVDTAKVNAYVTGIGRTKRIVLWDTLLAKLTPGQTKFVVGHELGHYVLGHVWTSMLLSSLLTILGLFGAHHLSTFTLTRFGARMGFDRLSDVASLPLLMILLSLFSLAITPAALALFPLPRTPSRPLRPGSHARQPRRRHCLRGLATAEPVRPSPRQPLQALPRQPSPDRRARRLHQQLSPLATEVAR